MRGTTMGNTTVCFQYSGIQQLAHYVLFNNIRGGLPSRASELEHQRRSSKPYTRAIAWLADKPEGFAGTESEPASHLGFLTQQIQRDRTASGRIRRFGANLAGCDKYLNRRPLTDLFRQLNDGPPQDLKTPVPVIARDRSPSRCMYTGRGIRA